MIGPAIPEQHSANRSITPDDDENEEAGPSTSIGPFIPPEVLQQPRATTPPTVTTAQDEDDDDDDYAPALPPDLVAARAGPSAPPPPTASSRHVQGPALPPGMRQRRYEDDSDEDDDVGPMPLPQGVYFEEEDGVTEFLKKEERRRKAIEEAAKPKTLQREEWMLVPPSSSDLLGSIDPTKLTKPRQFQRTSAPSRDVDNSLWTETPAERQQRIADEVAGKRRRAANADPDVGDEHAEAEARKRRRRDEEIRKGVDEYTRNHRGGTLIEQHTEKTAKETKKDDDGPPVIWDHSRDMSLGGRLMDDSTRNKFITDAKGLSDRFGAGKSGGFL